MKRLVAFLIVLLAAPSAHAQPTSDVDIAAKTAREDAFPSPVVDFPDKVAAYPQVEIANYVGFRPVRMDMYRERGEHPRRPAILWVHGGGWSRGDARTSGAFANWPAVLASLAARGFVVVAVDYRLSGEARFPAAVQDVRAAVGYLRGHAGELGVDASRIYLWGGSAGGQLAALAALTCGSAEYAPPPSTGRLERRDIAALAAKEMALPDDCVQGVALWYGVFDLEHTPKVDVAAYLGCDPAECRSTARGASPLHRARKGVPPMLLIHGTADKTVAFAQSEAMVAALRDVGGAADLLSLPGVDHGFMGETPEATREASLRALDRTFAFFDTLAGRRTR